MDEFKEVTQEKFHEIIGKFEKLEIHIVNPYSYPYTSEFRHVYTRHVWGKIIGYYKEGTVYPVLNAYFINQSDLK